MHYYFFYGVSCAGTDSSCTKHLCLYLTYSCCRIIKGTFVIHLSQIIFHYGDYIISKCVFGIECCWRKQRQMSDSDSGTFYCQVQLGALTVTALGI